MHALLHSFARLAREHSEQFSTLVRSKSGFSEIKVISRQLPLPRPNSK